jgi:hypothetical protein
MAPSPLDSSASGRNASTAGLPVGQFVSWGPSTRSSRSGRKHRTDRVSAVMHSQTPIPQQAEPSRSLICWPVVGAVLVCSLGLIAGLVVMLWDIDGTQQDRQRSAALTPAATADDPMLPGPTNLVDPVEPPAKPADSTKTEPTTVAEAKPILRMERIATTETPAPKVSEPAVEKTIPAEEKPAVAEKPKFQPALPAEPAPFAERKPAAEEKPAGPVCRTYNTTVKFMDNPTDAAAEALKQNKLLFVLHVAGNFEDDRFT